MAVELATGYVSLTVSAKGIKGDIERELGAPVAAAAKNAEQSATRSLQSTSASFTKFGVGALAVAGVVGAGLLETGQSASNLGESINAVNVTFGDAADGILKLGEDAATSVGLSNTAFNGLAVQFSAFASTIAGKGGDVVSTMSDMTTRAADFASVMNIDVADAARIFQSGLAGETEPLKKFGIDLSEAAVKAYAAANGIGTVGKEMTEAEKVQARYGALMEQTSKTQGDFANTSDSAANATRIAKAEMENASASLGESLTPAMAFAATTVASLAGGFAKLNDATGGWLGKGLGIGVVALGAAGAVSLVVGQVTKFKGALDTMRGAMTNAEGGLSRMGTSAKAVGIGLGIAAAAMAVYTINAKQNAAENKELADSIGEVSRATDADLMKTYFEVIAKGFITGKDLTATMNELAQANLDGAKRIRDFTEASIAAGTGTKAQITTIDALNTAIAKEDAAVAQLAKTTADAASATDDLTGTTTRVEKPLQRAAEVAAYYEAGLYGVAGQEAEAARQAEVLSNHLDFVTNSWDILTGRISDDQAWIDVQNTFADVAANYDKNGNLIIDKTKDVGQQMRDAATDVNALRQKVVDYGKAGDDLPPQKVTEYLALIDQGKFDDVERKLGILARARAIDILFDVRTRSSTVGPVQDRAAGGPAGGLTLVGELGPELVNLPQGSYVHTAADTRALMASSSSLTTATSTPPITIVNNRRDIGVADLNHVLAMARLAS